MARKQTEEESTRKDYWMITVVYLAVDDKHWTDAAHDQRRVMIYGAPDKLQSQNMAAQLYSHGLGIDDPENKCMVFVPPSRIIQINATQVENGA